MSTTVTSKGQVTIPKKVRDYLGIEPGTAVDFTLDANGRIVVTKAGASPRRDRDPDRFERVRGILKGGMSTDELMRLTRGDIDE